MSKLLSTSETIALLDRLRLAMRDLVTRSGQIERDFVTRTTQARTQFERAASAQREKSSANLVAEQNETATRRTQAETQFLARQARIDLALERSLQRRLAVIDRAAADRTVAIQRQLLDADQAREVDAENQKNAREEITALLADRQLARIEMDKKARATLRAYPSWTRSLERPLAPEPSIAGTARQPGNPATVAATGAPDLKASPETPLFTQEHQWLAQMQSRLETAEHQLRRCHRRVLPVVFRLVPLWVGILVAVVGPLAFEPAFRRFDFPAIPNGVWSRSAAWVAGVVLFYWLGRRLASGPAHAAINALREARELEARCAGNIETSFVRETERLQRLHRESKQTLNSEWKQAQSEARTARASWSSRLEEQAHRLHARNEAIRNRRLAQITDASAQTTVNREREHAARSRELEAAHAEGLARLQAARDRGLEEIGTAWRTDVAPAYVQLQESTQAADEQFKPWQPELWHSFQLPERFAHAAKFGRLDVDLEKASEVSLASSGLKLPGPARFAVPLLLSVPNHASLLFETKEPFSERLGGVFNNLILRLLTSAPPGRVGFTVFDPVGLGQNFAGLMHLADFADQLINSRIWTQQSQFEQRLAELNEHIEKVTQMYLRNEYKTLVEYNAQAGRMAERYHFLILADFPVNFSEVAVKRLMNIAVSGPRCGVYVLTHWDQRRPAPVEFVPDELRKHAIRLVPQGESFTLADLHWDGTQMTLDRPPEAELATRLLHQIGQASANSNRVEMPFEEVAPKTEDFWTLETTHELRVAIGRTGATKLQYLALGKGTQQHVLVAGKTGSGKSTLFHVLITNLALWCSPEQVEFYLVDFKKGVEFKCYATQKLPHARVVAIESDREFGLSVLQRVDEELKHRGDLFRKLGAQDIPGYKRAGGAEAMPRVILLIDEFQELFVEDDRVSQSAALLLDRIVRQGRAFGIHVILGSQTLGGAYTLARATMGQMVVRIALQCNEADASLIMTEDNPAPRLLSRPGEAIYNDEAGAIQGNSPFQIVWLPDDVRETWLVRVRQFAERRPPIRRDSAGVPQLAEPEAGTPTGGREPIIFEGNAPAAVHENPLLRSALSVPPTQPATTARVWLGAPNSIKGPTEAIFRRASGHHLLVVGQRDEAALAMLGLALVALAAQQPRHAARFYLFDASAPDSAEATFLQQVVRIIPHEIHWVHPGDTDRVMATLAADLQQRMDNPGLTAPETYLLVHRLQVNKKLRFDEEMSFSMEPSANAHPGLLFNRLICEGASLGFHVIATCDTHNNLTRMLSRKAISEFEMRVVFQMSAHDSASLIESSQANNLGLHRAILFNGHEGWQETFRPYALPGADWLNEAGRRLASRPETGSPSETQSGSSSP